jgi:transcriptional regulator with XRE-family HTH domain
MIYENIKELCETKKLSIHALEQKAGIGNGTIGRWKNSSPQIDTLAKVAAVLNVSVSRLTKE